MRRVTPGGGTPWLLRAGILALVLAVPTLVARGQTDTESPDATSEPSGEPHAAASPAAAAADPVAAKRLADARKRLDDVQRRIETAVEKEEALLAALDETGRELAMLAEDVATLKEQVAAARARSEEHRVAMEEIRSRIVRRKQWLAGRLRSLYVHGRPGYLRILFASESYGDLLRRTKYQSIIARHDARMVGELRQDLDEIGRRRTDYEQDLALLEGMEGEARVRSEEMALEHQLRASLLAEVQSERSNFEKMRDALERASEALTDHVASLGSGDAPPALARPFAEGKGKLLPPVTGVPVLLPFGPYRHPRLGLPMMHQGIKYAAPVGAEVHAVFDGKVFMADWYRSYGQVLIIDHGDGWKTLYAHNSRLFKRNGDAVHEGELIAQSGDTGSIDGPMLFFAIYREGKPVDPADWLVR